MRNKRQETEPVKRTVKDGAFRMLFSEKKNLLELYNALEGTDYGADTEITMETIEDALFIKRKNDLAFTIGDRFVVLMEHQSTVNRNMPLRMLLYLARIYDKRIKDGGGIYGENVRLLPQPEFYVFYNGKKDYPLESVLHLSDSYPPATGKPMLDLQVKVINVNYEMGSQLLSKCKAMSEYSWFVSKARELKKAGCTEEEAVRETVRACRDKNILKEFLNVHGGDVMSVLFEEITMEEYGDIRAKEAREDGIKQGIEQGIEQGIAKGREQERELRLEFERKSEARIRELEELLQKKNS